ncbi:hypothetical protein J2Y45_006743 [Dyadobacter sp. BE34]|uniref:Uncharacterized protein n=1 Tax=Dyadobacter fermentans TaxID=94254 RepID=A0ABU1R8C8_9BACT|nr:hypothetical protein [Dyadobacter fermentans]MDR7047344.1 hypothetical protein [Dyadobacter sp. BE242]MDR7201579.1 hypothetical protein [Dyadobacter sp. BE34]MDR7219449.1 hypothetical protein [Dyadobacter sp. BE31]MDR7267156.1 hypothetical protein [Dyadobacter sp. BE32]
MLSRLLQDTKGNCEKRKRHLIPVLTRLGISLDDFLAKMESNAKSDADAK